MIRAQQKNKIVGQFLSQVLTQLFSIQVLQIVFKIHYELSKNTADTERQILHVDSRFKLRVWGGCFDERGKWIMGRVKVLIDGNGRGGNTGDTLHDSRREDDLGVERGAESVMDGHRRRGMREQSVIMTSRWENGIRKLITL